MIDEGGVKLCIGPLADIKHGLIALAYSQNILYHLSSLCLEIISVMGWLRFQAIRLTLRPHLVGMLPPVGLPSVGSSLEGTVVRIDPTGLLLTVRNLASTVQDTMTFVELLWFATLFPIMFFWYDGTVFLVYFAKLKFIYIYCF